MVIRPTHPSSHPHPHPHPPIPRLHLETAPFGTVRRKGAGGVGRVAEGHTRLASGQRSLLLFCHPGHPARACEDHGRASKQPSSLGSFPSVGGGFHSCLPPVPFRSVAQSCPTLCDPMSRSTPGLPVHPHLPEFTQTHVPRVRDAIQPSHPRSSPSPPAPNPSQHPSLFPVSPLFECGGQSTGVSALASFLPKKCQG